MPAPPEPIPFSCRTARSPAIVWTIGALIVLETAALHLLLVRRVPLLAWGLTAASLSALVWLWSEFGLKRGVRPKRRERAPGDRPLVNILGPAYGTFNLWSDLAELRRLIEGIGAEVHLVFPLGAHLADVPRLVDADASVVMYREFGATLAEALERPWLRAPPPRGLP